jgi:hypothetical protein
MATREEKNLTDQIHKLAQQLKLNPPPTDGLDARQLSETLDQLRTLEGQRASESSSASETASREPAPPAEGPKTQSAAVNQETGISPVEAEGSVRTEGLGKVLPESSPDEIAPVPDVNGGESAPKPAPSSTGYRVAPGKAVISGRGDMLSDGAEIGERDVSGGVERLEELANGGSVVKTDKS